MMNRLCVFLYSLICVALLISCTNERPEPDEFTAPEAQIPLSNIDVSEEGDNNVEKTEYDLPFEIDNEDIIHSRAEMMIELREMAIVQEAELTYIDDSFQLRITIADSYSDNDIKTLFEAAQWGISYVTGDRTVWKPRTMEEDAPDTTLCIVSSEGYPLYEIRGVNMGQYDYRWFETIRPGGEMPFSFLYADMSDMIYKHDDWSSHQILIDDVLIFCYVDSDELLDILGITMRTSIKAVITILGEPFEISTEYSPTYQDEAYQENFVYTTYDFGTIFFANYRVEQLTITKAGHIGPRGIRIGDPYETVLQAFPLQEAAPQPEFTWFPCNILYDLDDDCGWEEFNQDGVLTNITYVWGRSYLDFEIIDGLVSKITFGYMMDW